MLRRVVYAIAALAAACGGETSPAPSVSPAVDASTTPPDMAACKTDADCNEDPAISSTQHTCFSGVCVCRAPFHVQVSGKCGQGLPRDCTGEGGTCRHQLSDCGPGNIQAGSRADQTCGDFVAAVCCIPSCKAPADLVCCRPDKSADEPVCVDGWRTCEGLTPSLRANGCR